MSAPLMRRKAGRPKQNRYKAWFEKGGSGKKGKKDGKPKRVQKVIRIDASSVKNLDTELALPSVYTLLKDQSMFMFIQNLCIRF